MLNQSKPISVFNFKPGTCLRGKWHQRTYYIKEKLGTGAVGAVYLAKQDNDQWVALKISDKAASITSEINVLKKLAKVQGESPGPSLYEIDDWIDRRGECYPFYTMEYVQGESLDKFLNKRGRQWLGVLFPQLLEELEQLHRVGFILGDLKIENVIVTHRPIRLRFIDVGGVTLIGRSVKEYTEFYDRGYWHCGNRTADPAYDLFALAMMALRCAYPNQFRRTKEPKKYLITKLKQASILKPYDPIFHKALLGQYQNSQEMQQDFKKRTRHLTRKSAVPQDKQEIDWLEIVICISISVVLFFLATFY
ncbi:protein kinase domain-containing protein [Amphibacillus cookii]|uniref:protein kinase domain-containing protein n=1 Tax=Amphibacillus cookii TaxID=767787 RepID=UPI00195727D4|nr:phosphotransferase [Amphibacillus cookii]MBM7543187.1 serine/threonine-protein kinase [Amphibacillus cookii]